MKLSVPLALIICGTILVLMPMIHHLLCAKMVASTLSAVSKPGQEGSSVKLPSFDTNYYWVSVGVGIAAICSGILLVAALTRKVAGQ